MGPRAGLQLREQVTHVGLDGLLAEEEPHPDLAVDETVGNELEHFDLPHRRLLLELLQGAVERNYLAIAVPAARRRDLLEAPGMVHIAGQDLFALSCVHGPSIGAPGPPL